MPSAAPVAAEVAPEHGGFSLPSYGVFFNLRNRIFSEVGIGLGRSKQILTQRTPRLAYSFNDVQPLNRCEKPTPPLLLGYNAHNTHLHAHRPSSSMGNDLSCDVRGSLNLLAFHDSQVSYFSDYETNTNTSDLSTESVSSGFAWPPENRAQPDTHLKFFRSSYDLQLADPEDEDTVIVNVGEAESLSTFFINADVLQKGSLYFQVSLQVAWFDSSTRTIAIPDLDPALFDLYVRWLATGAEILTEEDDWKAAYAEYLKWKLEQESDREHKSCVDDIKILCPVTVWDFERTADAWQLGDYFMNPEFQNHCLGLLYYMNLRFDHMVLDPKYSRADIKKGYMSWGTVAYLRVEDVIRIWENTLHTPFDHQLRDFYLDWLIRYWDTLKMSAWDDDAQRAVERLVESCPGLTAKIMQGMVSPKELRREERLGPLSKYWVPLKKFNMEDVWELMASSRSAEHPHRRVSITGAL